MTTKQTTVRTTARAADQAAAQGAARRRRWVRLAVLGPAAALVLQSGVVPAQQAPDLSPAVAPPRAAAATGPSTNPISSTNPSIVIPTQATRPAPTRISINFRDVSVDTVLEHLSDVAGFIIIKEAPVTGRVTVIAKEPVTPEEAVALLNTVLKGNGYTAIRTGRTLKITTIENAKKGNIPVRFGADPDQIPETDDVVTQIIPVRSVDAVKLKADIQPLVGSGADLASNGGSNSIIVTDNSANIKRVVTIIASLDKKDAGESGIRIKQLKFADATSAAKLITDIFKTPDQQAQGQGGFNPAAFFRGLRGGGGGGGGFPGGGGGGGGDAAAADKGRIGTVMAEADTRTNTIVVTGPTDTLKVIDDVLAQLDANPAADQTFFIYKVKNGQAIDIQTTLNTLFGVNVSSAGSSRTSSSSLSSNRLGSGTGSSSSSFGGSGGSSGFGGSGGSSFGGSSSSTGNRSTSGTGTAAGTGSRTGGGGSGSTGLTGAAANLIGQVEVVADTDTNQLLVATATKYEQQVRDILKQLDRPVPQVLIKVLVAEVTHDRSDDLGADFSVLNLRASGEGQSYGSQFGNTGAEASSGGLAVAVLERHVSAQIHALAEADKLEVLSRPYILTSDNQEAFVSVGQEVPIITNTQVTEAGSTINSTRYEQIGVSLDVTPHINPDGLVTMDISPQITSLSETSITIQSGITNPIFNQRQADSHVAIRDGETIVIGGLMQDQKTQTVSKIPLLGDIPYLGLIFQRDQVTKTKTELLIFLTPHVALSPEVLQRMSADEMNGVQLTPNAVQPGTFPYHMQGLRRGGPATAPVLPVPIVPRDRDAWEPEPRLP